MIRKSSKRARGYNDGLVVFLYDPSFSETIETQNPELLGGFAGNASLRDETLLGLARAGQLVAYEKLQDDELDIEIAVGEHLTAAEQKRAPWAGKPQRAFISLPSGKLRVESYNSLSLTDEEPMEKGTTVKVPPGDYLLTLYRVDGARLASEEWKKVKASDELVILTPLEPGEDIGSIAAMLTVGDAEIQRWPFEGEYEIRDGVFSGKTMTVLRPEWGRRLCLNLDASALTALGWRRGDRIKLKIDGEEFTLLCNGKWFPSIAKYFWGDETLRELAGLEPNLIAGYSTNTSIGMEPGEHLFRDELPGYCDYFACGPFDDEPGASSDLNARTMGLFELGRGIDVELWSEPPPFFELDPSVKNWHRLEDGEIHCRVLSHAGKRLFLNIEWSVLEAAGFVANEPLEIQIGSEKRGLYLSMYPEVDEDDEAPVPLKARQHFHYPDFSKSWRPVECSSALAVGDPPDLHWEIRAGDPVIVRKRQV